MQRFSANTKTARSPGRIIGGSLVLLLLALSVGVLVRSGQQTLVNPSGLHVVAAENFWGDIAAQLGGQYAHVTSIISDPTADPHLYESSAQNASAVASADIVIMNGLGYDDFMTKLLNASSNPTRTVLTAAQILNVPAEANPHLWYDLPRVGDVAVHIATAYEAQDPAHKSIYQHNLAQFQTSMQPLLATLHKMQTTYTQTPVAYTERVPGYILDVAGLSVQTPPGFASAIEDGNDPSPADTARMESLVSDHRVRALLYNAQAVTPITAHIRELATAAHIPVVGVTETLPTNERNYQSWQQHQLNNLLHALEAQPL